MQVMTTASSAPVLADGSLLDGKNMIALGVAALSGGGVARLFEVLTSRKKLHADAADVVTGAMTEVMTAAVELLKPQTEQLLAIQERHRADMQALRDEHAQAMSRVQSEHGAAMERLGTRIEQLELELRDVRTENAELKGRMSGPNGQVTGEHPATKSVD